MAQLEKDISKGGLKLRNLFLFNRALKLCWIKRLVEGSGNWQKLFEVMLGLRKKNIKYLLEKCDSALAVFYSTTFTRDGS